MLALDSLHTLEVLLVLTCISIAYYGYSSNAKRRGSRLPPGPKGWPIIGSMLEMPTSFHWLKYAEWSKQYGPIVHVNLLGRNVIILSSPKLVHDFSEKRHTTYSERPRFPMMTELVGWDRATVFMSVGPLWKEHRRNFSKLFGTKAAVSKFYALEMYEARRLMRNILTSNNLVDHIRYWAGSLALKIAYGYEAKTGHDDLVELVDEAMEQFTILGKPGKFLVDFIPVMKYIPAWVPGADFQRKAKYYRDTLTNMIEIPFNMVQKQLKAGTAKPSFTSDLLSSDDYTLEKEYALKTSAATIYAGAADTTAGQIHAFYLMMMLFPEARKKAQQEIDKVVGPERLPDFNDRENLPYVEACMKEAMRLHTLVPSGGTRQAPKDDVVEGYFIPKGAIIQPNIWQMTHDPEVYPNPFEYVPERWLVDDPPPHPRDLIFGFGRRICPGMVLADASMWIATAMFLALFDIKRVEGSPTFYDQSMNGVLDGQPLCHPKPFKSEITPRNAKAEALILSIDNEH